MVGDVVAVTSAFAATRTQPAAAARVLARFGHALSDPTRARLLLALRQAPGYPADLADELGVSRQNLSNHLSCLRDCGLVVSSQEGRRVRYALADPALGHALSDLLSAVAAIDPLAQEDHR
ncbi:winged helix-turn-helix transcriptional regulator [Quadrisphaera setariae]|uniref:Winged helix-turn-helix transcriptional regulator n=1 Tax=Quadrisphaera setariae TaxID=2593304 RepID=A0A5C8Z4G9_9ACTN|nr:winged helix-turn-helix transcriptional regulator [Quadrisphaera setariae]